MSEAIPPNSQPDFSELFNLDDLNPATADTRAPLSLAEVATVTHLVRELQQHNAQLVRHVKELEAALDKSQSNLQQQLTQGHDQEVLMMQQLQEMVAAQSHITRLMTELESSHQTAQRQQALIEALTEQLQPSQEQVAQLERECALKQQQCQEQAHLLVQQEEVCSELRSQLQQQRQQTSQFKAALEKCLKKSVSPHSSLERTEPNGDLEFPVSPCAPLELVHPIDVPLAQPWFVGAEAESPTQVDDKVAGMLQELPLSMMESYLLKSVPAEADGEPDLTVPALSENLDLSQDLTDPETDFWQSLEQLIDSPRVVMPAPAFSQASVETEEPTDHSSIPLKGATNSRSLEAATKLEGLSFLGEYRNSKPVGDAMPSDLYSISPSPLVYPQRSTKKLPSLAAVDLPNFPKLTAR